MERAATIFALSSGAPPAAIAIVRISGAGAAGALGALAGPVPPPRRAALRTLRAPGDPQPLDRALVLWFPGPDSATGEDLAELHLHGGRAVVAAVLDALARFEGLRAADPGEFTRRAFANGRIDLAEAEGLADLLAAETESQRRNALVLAGGGLSRRVEEWREALLAVSARVEALLDFSDEDDVGDEDAAAVRAALSRVAAALGETLANPPAERLRDGIRVVLAGPPNAGKSTLLNALAGREAAIAAPRAGTTRDLIEAPVAIDGIPLLLVDTAGLREARGSVERIGVARAHAAAQGADILLWLGEPAECPAETAAILVHAKADRPGREAAPAGSIAVSAHSGLGMPELRARILTAARDRLPAENAIALNQRQRAALEDGFAALHNGRAEEDLLLIGEHLRVARDALDRLIGRVGVEDMLDALFGRFCIGK